MENIVIPISTIIVTLIIHKFELSNIYYGVIYGCITQLLVWLLSVFMSIRFDYDILITIIKMLIIKIIFLCLIGIIYHYFFHQKYATITIYDKYELEIFNKYVKYNKKYFDISDISIGDYYNIFDQKVNNKLNTHDSYNLNNIMTPFDKKIKFHDKNLDIKGYYCWKQSTEKISDKKDELQKMVAVKYIEIKILAHDKINPNKIIKNIYKFVKNKEKTKCIVLRYIKLVQAVDEYAKIPYYEFVNRSIPFYKGQIKPLIEQEKKYIKTIFHPIKDELWNTIKNNILNPNYYHENGQCGRVSILLHGPPGSGKSTIAYRIAMCLFRHIISIDLRYMTKANLYQIMFTPNISLCKNYKKAIYLFEEFDISLKSISENNINSLDQKNDIGIMQTMRDNIALVPRDLLELFQGPVQLERSIIIATTNKYDDIKNLCPELFRPGRLTPIYFGYIDVETLQDISLHFFKKKILWRIPEIITIPTSQIITLALDSKIYDSENPFDYFSKKLAIMFDNS